MKNAKTDFITALTLHDKAQSVATCKGGDLLIVIGTLLSRDNQIMLHEIATCVQEENASLVYLFTMEEKSLQTQTTFFSRYEAGSEEGVLALLAQALLADIEIPLSLQTYFDNLDDGYLSAESNMGEEEIEAIQSLYRQSQNVVLVLGADLVTHPRANNIARLAGLIATYGKAKILLSPNDTIITHETNESMLEEVASLKSFDGVVIYRCPALNQEEEGCLMGSLQFQMAAKVQHGEKIQVVINQAIYPRIFVLDESLKGTIALMPCTQNEDISYRYNVAKIVK